jgi:large subunit ribosomal protein L25
MLALAVTARDSKESAESVRRRGFVPAVFYGAKEEATPIAIDSRTLASTWRSAGETTIITLQGVGEPKETLIRDVQVHPVTGSLMHADFYVLEKGKKIEIKVPLEFVGQAPAEKAGHIIVKALHEVEIEVAPAELPHNLPVDLSTLENVGDHITVADIKLPPSAKLRTNAEDIVASVTEFKEEVVEAPPAPTEAAAAAPAEGEAAPAPATPEPEKKEGKKE